MAHDYSAKINKVLTIKKQSTRGTYTAPSSSADSVLIEDITINDNWQTIKSNESSGTVDKGADEVTHAEPEVTGSFKLRGSGDPATAPRGTALLETGGFSVAAKLVLPSSGTFACSAGTVSSFEIDRAAGNGSQLPSDPSELVGRIAELTTNPATLRRVHIEACSLTGTVLHFEIADVLPVALDTSTTVKLVPGQMFDLNLAPDDVPVASVEAFEDGAVTRFRDMQSLLEFSVTHAQHVIVKMTLRGIFYNWANAALPTDMNFAALPPPPKWRKGRARLAKRALACTSFDAKLNTKAPQHGDPEQDFGKDAPRIVERDIRSTLVTNKVKPGTADIRAIIAANTLMPVSVVLDIDGPAGTRWALLEPNGKIVGRSGADAEGVEDDSFEVQAVRVSPLTALRAFMF